VRATVSHRTMLMSGQPFDRQFLLKRISTGLLAATVSGITIWYGLFRLPYVIPPAQRLTSTAYALGFNNRMAIAAMLVFVAIATAATALRRRVIPGLRFCGVAREPLSWWLLTAMSAVYGLLTTALYWFSMKTEWYQLDWEASHFLWRLRLSELYHLRPYGDYQFEYGPLLAYGSIFMHRLLAPSGASYESSYYILHCVLNVAGLLTFAFVLNRVLMPPRNRMIIFVLIGLAGFLPNMGLNGVLLRYSAPLFSIVWLHDVARTTGRRRSVRIFAVSLAGAALCISLSSEAGIVFLISLAAYGFLTIRQSVISGPVLGGMITAAAFCPLLLPGRYYVSMASFSQGANNLPFLETSPHLLLYIGTLIFFVPKWFAALTTARTDQPLLPVLGSVCITMMPGAMGRCDPYHVLFYGLVPSALALAHLANTRQWSFRLFAGVYAVCFLFLLPVINGWVHGTGFGSLARTISGRTPTEPNLESLRKYDALVLPYGSYGYSKAVQQWLWNNRKVAPEYYMGGMGIYTQADVADRLKDIGRFRYALIFHTYTTLHVRSEGEECGWHWNYLRKAFLYPWEKPCVQRALMPDAEISEFLATHYCPIEKVGDYLVLERVELSETLRDRRQKCPAIVSGS
jgi:hypothetical protein